VLYEVQNTMIGLERVVEIGGIVEPGIVEQKPLINFIADVAHG
jgi:hypothetical protein